MIKNMDNQLPPVEPQPVANNNPAPPSEIPMPPVNGPEIPAPSVPPTPFEPEPSGGIKRFLPFVLAGILLVGLVLAMVKFILPRFSVTKGAEITYWGLWESEEIMGSVIADFEKDNPGIKVKYIYNSPKEYRERLASALAQGKGPDIFRYHNSWVPMFKNDLAAIPDSVMSNSDFEKTYYPVTVKDLKSGGNYVGIPLEIDGLAMFVNEDIFRNAGKVPPTTWDELRKVAVELTTPLKRTRGQIEIAGAALGRTENVDHWSDILAVLMLQNGVDLNKPTGQLAEDALIYFTLFSQSDLVWDETLPSSTIYFAQGKLGIYFGPSWEVFTIKEANPNLNFRILPIPQLGEPQVTWASYWVEGVNKKGENQLEAWKFLKYLSSQEVMERLYKTQSATRLFGEPYARREMANLLENVDYIGPYIQQASIADSWYLSSRTHDNGLNDKIISYFADAVNAVNMNKATAKQALETAASGVAQTLNQYGISASVVR